ncbi:MAG: DsbA family protein [Rhodospirillales bacterium]|jgi:protein-disulfide isomerase|nr:DsbA family protein [Rhodospirillales bacterium]
MKHPLAFAVAVGLVAAPLLFAAPASAADPAKAAGDAASALSEGQSRAVEALVRQYILDHPEVIIESMQNYQIRQQIAEQEAATAALAAHRDEIKNDASAPVAGNPKGDVTVVEFFDYRCAYCKRVLPSVRELLETDKNVRYVFKELPILGPDSVTASRAALAAWKIAPDKYFAFHTALMEARGELGEEQVLQIAEKVGLDRKKLKDGMAAPEVEKTIQRNLELAQKLRIQGTPAFIVGDALVPGAIDLEQLKDMVATARKG